MRLIVLVFVILTIQVLFLMLCVNDESVSRSACSLGIGGFMIVDILCGCMIAILKENEK